MTDMRWVRDTNFPHVTYMDLMVNDRYGHVFLHFSDNGTAIFYSVDSNISLSGTEEEIYAQANAIVLMSGLHIREIR